VATAAATCSSTASRADATTVQPSTRSCPTRRRCGPGDPEPSITVDRHLVRISLVCGRVDGFTDPLPDDVFDAVDFLLIDRRHKAELRANPTYDTAARCFLEAIEEKKRKYSENEERDSGQR
jgi:hypothetical protein